MCIFLHDTYSKVTQQIKELILLVMTTPSNLLCSQCRCLETSVKYAFSGLRSYRAVVLQRFPQIIKLRGQRVVLGHKHQTIISEGQERSFVGCYKSQQTLDTAEQEAVFFHTHSEFLKSSVQLMVTPALDKKIEVRTRRVISSFLGNVSIFLTQRS